MDDIKRDELGRFLPGERAALQHGQGRAVKALASGCSLTGIAAELKIAVHEEIEQRGLVAVMRERAERHQAVADLFFGLVLGQDDEEILDLRVRRFGWLNASAFRMLRELEQMERERGGGDVLDAIAVAKEAGNG